MKFRFGHIILIGGMLMVSLFSVKCKSNKAMIQEFGNLNTPDDNPITDAKVELGRKLFFDKRLSLDNTVSCATCHIPAFGFTDRKKVSDGVLGRKTERNSPSLLNAGYLPTVMFDAHLTSLEMQVIVPIQEHVEMGMKMSEVIERLKAVPEYQKAARDVFNITICKFSF
jgi:cytochrome c peroxidase